MKDPDEGSKDTEEGPTFKYTQEGPVRYCTEEEVRALGSRVITMYPTSMFMTEESPDESPVTEEEVSDDEADVDGADAEEADTSKDLVMRYKGAINALGYALKALVESSKPARIGSSYSDAALQSLDDSNNVVFAQDAGIPDEVFEAAVAAAHASRLAVAAIDAARDAIAEATKANSAAFYASVASLIATKPPAEAVVLADAVYAVRQAEKAELAAIDALMSDEPRL